MMIQHFCTDNWDFTNHKKSQEWNQQKLARSLNTSYYIFLLFASKMRGFFIPELSIIWLYVHIASTAPFLMLKSPLDHVSAPWDGDHITTEHRITLQLCKMPWQKACHSARQFFQISPIISNQSDSIMSMCIVKYLQSPPITSNHHFNHHFISKPWSHLVSPLHIFNDLTICADCHRPISFLQVPRVISTQALVVSVPSFWGINLHQLLGT